MKKILAISFLLLFVLTGHACDFAMHISSCMGSSNGIRGVEIKIYCDGIYYKTLYTNEYGAAVITDVQMPGIYDFFMHSAGTNEYGSVRNFELNTCYLPVYWCIKHVPDGISGEELRAQFTDEMKSQIIDISGVELYQNYPNPFNPVTKIKYYVPSSANSQNTGLNIILKVYDMNGREVKTLVDEQKLSGTYEAEFDASSLASGVYYYQLSSGNFTETRKMLVVK